MKGETMTNEEILELAIEAVKKDQKVIRVKRDKAIKKYEKGLAALSDKLDILLEKRTANTTGKVNND